jgi:hypothetical protein
LRRQNAEIFELFSLACFRAGELVGEKAAAAVST